jgi:TolB protein
MGKDMKIALLKTAALAAVMLFTCAGTCNEIKYPDDVADALQTPENDYRAVEEKGPIFRRTASEAGDDAYPAVSYDGKTLFYSSTNHTPLWQIYGKPLQGSLVMQITQSQSANIYPTPSPDGRTLAFVSNRPGRWDIYLMQYSPKLGDAYQLCPASKTAKVHPSWSPDGKKIVFSEYNTKNQQWELAVYNFEDNSISYPGGGINALFPDWCPAEDSKTIVFQRASDAGSGAYALWLIESDGSKLMCLFESADYACINPTWTPDGKSVAYATVAKSPETSGEWEKADDIWIVNADGSGNRQITHHEASDWSPCFTHDGKQMMFVSTRGGHQNIWSIPLSK